MNEPFGMDLDETLFSGANAAYLTELYRRFLNDPGSVGSEWAALFRELGDPVESRSDTAQLTGRVVGHRASERGTSLDEAAIRQATLDSIRALMIIRVYRVRGHLIARLDPLGLDGRGYHPELDPETWGFGAADLDRPIFINQVLGMETATLRQIMQILEETYCGSIGVEFMHIQDPDEKAWIQQRIESIHNQSQFTDRGKRTILERLIHAEELERFLHRKFPGTKRFGLDGAESLIPGIEQILKRGAQLGVEDVNLGMPHRGRLNVLTNLMHKPYVAIFAEFQGASAHPDDMQGSGDVKYHLGTSADRVFDGHRVHLSLAANPSHLEAVDPVVLGKVRAKQTQRGDVDRRKVMAVLLHGDAAFAGQGLVAECFGLSELEGYRTGGTIHFIVNNQIGFTTSPAYSRSSPYPSDVAKMVQAPIFHVNGDDPEAVVHVARIAAEFRQVFGRDVVIDMFCYRRYGHNEADDPSFTQPRMYRAIAQHSTVRQRYAEQLIADGTMHEGEVEGMQQWFLNRLDADFSAATTYKADTADWLEGPWKGLQTLVGEEEMREYDTAVSVEELRAIGLAMTELPEGCRFHPQIPAVVERRRGTLQRGTAMDWATAEALAFGSLLLEGTPVRLSGQDSGRGTFSQRHSVLVDQHTEARYVPLNRLRDGQAYFEVIDSPLSESSVLGFEYGYSLADPDALVVWEAQFGDFANGAQVIIDQFIASGESKWLRLSGLVLLLPHGYDGQGPEHSSARPERYLQLCAEDNLQVVNCTTPANYFHVLRRQIRRNFRKPLIVFTPKSLLRHKLAVSDLTDFGPGTSFKRVLPEVDTLRNDAEVRRLVLCSGKVYYDLVEERRRRGIDDVALIRVEQLYPWPRQNLLEQIARYERAEVIWCQEEPANMGAWSFALPRLANLLEELRRGTPLPVYAGRPAAASPATGFYRQHAEEQADLVKAALIERLGSLPQPFRRAANRAH
ncbi:2-oxoglutarate dehydrogenase E1 component [Methylolobus aquaticus]